MQNREPDHYNDVVISDDLTRNWHAKIAVKITAVTLWPTIVMAFIIAYFLLNDIESGLKQEHNETTTLIAYEVATLWPKNSDLTFHEKLEDLKSAYYELDLPGFELLHEGDIYKVGNLEIHESYYDTSLTTLIGDDIEIRTFFRDPADETTSIRNQVLTVIFIALLLFAIFMNIATHIIIDKPLSDLVEATKTISKGNLNVRVDTSRSDEFGTMARFFNKMLDTLTKQKNLEHAARTDFLTGISNRRHFDETLSKELRRITRSNSMLSLIMCDVDFFKQYNDLYNHVAGDLCLKHIASTLSKVFNRAGDLVARFGGEEFVVILPDTDLATGKMMAKLLREELAKLKIPHERSEVSDYVTVSIGVASIQGTAQEVSADELLNAADSALYQAKKKGRDRIEAGMQD